MTHPEIVVLAADPASPIVRAVAAGCEEEGVPCGVRVGEGSAAELARAAAASSDLFVGVGVDAAGAVAVRDQRVRGRELLIAEAADDVLARLIGGDAARLVKGLPLRVALDGILPNRRSLDRGRRRDARRSTAWLGAERDSSLRSE